MAQVLTNMTAPKINWEISLSSIIHLVVLLSALAAAYGGASQRFAAMESDISTIKRQVNGMQHYLSSKDPEYWKRLNQNGDPDGQ